MGTHPIFESDFDCLTENLTRISEMLLDFGACLNERPEWWSQVHGHHESTIKLENVLKSIIISLNNLLSTYREVAKVEKVFRNEISKLNEFLPQTDNPQMRAIVTTMEELECSRRKLADNLERNVKHEVTSLYST